MPENFWWIWMIVAAVFVIGEIFTAAFFLLWFGVGAGVAGLMSLFGLGMAWQMTAFIVVSFVLFAVSRKFADRVSKPQPPGIGADRFEGKDGLVLEKIDSAVGTGRVRLGHEEWVAESEEGDMIPKGEKVRVSHIEGTHLIVKQIKEGE